MWSPWAQDDDGYEERVTPEAYVSSDTHERTRVATAVQGGYDRHRERSVLSLDQQSSEHHEHGDFGRGW
jgi:hypothetical protein